MREAAWEIPLPIVVLGGIYSGYFAISEAAAVTALYVLIVDVVILREIPLRKLPGVMRDSMVLVGGILVILGMSLASTNYMIDAGVPQKLLGYVSDLVSSELTFLLLLLAVPAGAGRDPRYLLRHRAGGAADPARWRCSTVSTRCTWVSSSWPRCSWATSRRRSV